MMNGCVESEPWVWIVAVNTAPLPRYPSIDEYHRTVIESPSASLATAENSMAAPNRPVLVSNLARWLERWGGEAIDTVGE